MARPNRPAGPAPTETSLREAALAHLDRHAASSAMLTRVLKNRVLRWLRAAGPDDEAHQQAAAAAQSAIPRVLAALIAAGAIDDDAFAASRARRLARSGSSRRRIAGHLAQRGIDAAIETDEFAAALAFARRRRLPPFGEAERLRALAAFARAGFPRDVAERALASGREEAEARLAALLRG